MGVQTSIPWAHHTFNPWWGCVEVSPACDHCYARVVARRVGWTVWGKDADRRFFGEDHWHAPFQWHRAAERAGVRRRVFCASMADLGEQRSDAVGHQLERLRERLWFVILNTPALDWLLLTTRPALYRGLVPRQVLERPNVWPGVTVESPAYLWRAEELIRVRCAGPRWVSYEPALEPIDVAPVIRDLAWIVVGGESGPKARPFDIDWAYDVIRVCRAAGAAPYVKQLGSHPVRGRVLYGMGPWGPAKEDEVEERIRLRDPKGENPAEWPEDLRVREFPGRRAA